MAEIEIGAMARQCLDRRVPNQRSLRREVEAWQGQRNPYGIRVAWRFTTHDARIKLKSLYPSIQLCTTTRLLLSLQECRVFGTCYLNHPLTI